MISYHHKLRRLLKYFVACTCIFKAALMRFGAESTVHQFIAQQFVGDLRAPRVVYTMHQVMHVMTDHLTSVVIL